MRLVFYLFFISQLLNFIGVFAEKVIEDSSRLNSIKWEKIEENKSKPLKKIIWRSYKNDESYFGNKKKQSSITKSSKSNEERISKFSKISGPSITEIEPYLPLNNFLEKGNLKTSVRWKSSFEGGASGGSGQQMPSFIFDYGISDSSLMTFYFSEADDKLYNPINGQKVDYHWQNYAFSFKKKLLSGRKGSISVIGETDFFEDLEILASFDDLVLCITLCCFLFPK